MRVYDGVLTHGGQRFAEGKCGKVGVFDFVAASRNWLVLLAHAQ